MPERFTLQSLSPPVNTLLQEGPEKALPSLSEGQEGRRLEGGGVVGGGDGGTWHLRWSQGKIRSQSPSSRVGRERTSETQLRKGFLAHHAAMLETSPHRLLWPRPPYYRVGRAPRSLVQKKMVQLQNTLAPSQKVAAFRERANFTPTVSR